MLFRSAVSAPPDGPARPQKRQRRDILSVLTPEERAQLDTLTDKLIVGVKEAGVSGKKKGRKVCKRSRKHRGGRRR